MFTVTFYSFKGGVGRTMALVNVAVSLARSGRRVLMVDFDLEAPGIETYPALVPPSGQKGMVEFVHDYLGSGKSPNAKEYIFEAKTGFDMNGGKLFVMPAGNRDDTYGKRLNDISWERLYSQDNGYLLFEDLKKQWKKKFKADYVLVDSRTGHTDVAGICTRQLPDVVVAMFLPNEQNLRGMVQLRKEVERENLIRRQQHRDLVQVIYLPSNVPDIDDEKLLLDKILKRFEKALVVKGFDAKLRHYQSLNLLDQEIFTAQHPNTSLARAYERLRTAIIKKNLDDADGARALLSADKRGMLDMQVLMKIFRNFTKQHNPEVLHLLAQELFSQRISGPLSGVASTAMELAILSSGGFSFGPTHDMGRFLRDSVNLLKPKSFAENAPRLWHILDNYSMPLNSVTVFLGALESLDKNAVHRVLKSPAFLAAPPTARLVFAERMLARSVDLSREILLGLADKYRKESAESAVDEDRLALALIGAHSPRQAMSILSPQRPTSKSDAITKFNYAVCEWLDSGVPPVDLFSLVANEKKKRDDPNYKQCRCIALWNSGSHVAAKELADELINDIKRMRGDSLQGRRKRIAGREPIIFSAWMYRDVSEDEFLQNLKDMRHQFEQRECWPAFFPMKS